MFFNINLCELRLTGTRRVLDQEFRASKHETAQRDRLE
jgi:hypothetical protein